MTPRREFAAGIRAELPILLGVLPFGLIYGALALQAGIPPRAGAGDVIDRVRGVRAVCRDPINRCRDARRALAVDDLCRQLAPLTVQRLTRALPPPSAGGMEGSARLLAHGRSLCGGDYTLQPDVTDPRDTAAAPRRTRSPPLVFLGGRAHAMDDVAGKHCGRALSGRTHPHILASGVRVAAHIPGVGAASSHRPRHG